MEAVNTVPLAFQVATQRTVSPCLRPVPGLLRNPQRHQRLPEARAAGGRGSEHDHKVWTSLSIENAAEPSPASRNLATD